MENKGTEEIHSLLVDMEGELSLMKKPCYDVVRKYARKIKAIIQEATTKARREERERIEREIRFAENTLTDKEQADGFEYARAVFRGFLDLNEQKEKHLKEEE